jgi:hypothetical protein
MTGTGAPARSPAVVFGVLWDAMTGIMGTAATATVLRRALKRASVRAPDLGQLGISRVGFEYRYETPPAWTEVVDGEAAMQPICVLVDELRPLLYELTGSVVLRRLVAIPEIRACGLEPWPEEPR